jgi:hypothetical protein
LQAEADEGGDVEDAEDAAGDEGEVTADGVLLGSHQAGGGFCGGLEAAWTARRQRTAALTHLPPSPSRGEVCGLASVSTHPAGCPQPRRGRSTDVARAAAQRKRRRSSSQR